MVRAVVLVTLIVPVGVIVKFVPGDELPLQTVPVVIELAMVVSWASTGVAASPIPITISEEPARIALL
ncbi:hypothetical protein TS85_08270 [Sphingomonas hengshuiensis]|uniref:Uncharacterized protein n=1 Tax=Sphingomonas hengshuiensis TaxID=1609977 RepID=A0A7U4J7Q7_9SPHN|nr:hypothetical protein TS85_08270 [Sphingomonas hengshuiensis]